MCVHVPPVHERAIKQTMQEKSIAYRKVWDNVLPYVLSLPVGGKWLVGRLQVVSTLR